MFENNHRFRWFKPSTFSSPSWTKNPWPFGSRETHHRKICRTRLTQNCQGFHVPNGKPGFHTFTLSFASGFCIGISGWVSRRKKVPWGKRWMVFSMFFSRKFSVWLNWVMWFLKFLPAWKILTLFFVWHKHPFHIPHPRCFHHKYPIDPSKHQRDHFEDLKNNTNTPADHRGSFTRNQWRVSWTQQKNIMSQAKRPSGPPDRVSAVRWYERTANPGWIHGTSPVYLPTVHEKT